MFESLSAAPRAGTDLRRVAPALTSVLAHAIPIGAAILASWMSLSSIPLPVLRPQLFQPVTFVPRAGAPAPRLGRQGDTSEASTTSQPKAPPSTPQTVPPKISQPLDVKEKTDESPEANPAVDTTAETPDASSLGPGDPTGVPGGDPRGKRGGNCVGDCDPEGPVGLGPGDRNGIDDAPPILTPGLAGVTQPVMIDSSRVLPVYPELARRAHIEGVVILQAVIQTDGRVDSVVLLRESPPRLGFGEAAIEAVRRWRYHPGLQQGRPVAVYFTITVEFSLTR